MGTIKIKSKNTLVDATIMKIGKIDVKVNYHPYKDKFPLMTVVVDYKNGEYFGTFDVFIEGESIKVSNFKKTENKVTKLDITGYEITGIDYEANTDDKQLMKFSKEIMDVLIKDNGFNKTVKVFV